MYTNVLAKKQNHSVGQQGATMIEEAMASVQKRFDPFGVTTSLLNAQAAWMMHPQELSRAIGAMSGDIIALQTHLMRRAFGLPSEDVVTPHADDARFAGPVWSDSATWDIVKETYLAITHRVEDMLFETPGLSDKERRRAAFWVRKWRNAERDIYPGG